MQSIKLSITLRAKLSKKYTPTDLAAIDTAITEWVTADAARGVRTIHLALDDRPAMQAQGVAPLTGRVTANKVKVALDALVAKLRPDYIVLVGAGDVVPYFAVPNPTATEDDEEKVPTDNPYACSRAFRRADRASYLIPDRVLGRMPDALGSGDAAWLLGCLKAARDWKSSGPERYAQSFMVCCDSWKGSGRDCAAYIGKDRDSVMISPPASLGSQALRGRQSRRLHMIKCHGSEVDSRFYGQKGNSYPEVAWSVQLDGRVKDGTVVGAMCCYGASLYDPDDPAGVDPPGPPISNVYLRQGAYGFLGSTNTAWVGPDGMLCADWVVAAFLRSMLAGASLGRAALEGKQDLVRWTQQEGNHMDSADEKTLLQFVLLGDPSIHPVKAMTPAAVTSASMAPVSASRSVVLARRARRELRMDMAIILRASLPRVTRVHGAKVPAKIQALAKSLASHGAPGAKKLSRTRVERVASVVSGPALAGTRTLARKPVERANLQYYWVSTRKKGHLRDIRLVSIQADKQGEVLQARVMASS